METAVKAISAMVSRCCCYGRCGKSVCDNNASNGEIWEDATITLVVKRGLSRKNLLETTMRTRPIAGSMCHAPNR